MKHKLVHVRMPKSLVTFVKIVAKMSDTTPTTVYNVLLAVAIVHLEIKK